MIVKIMKSSSTFAGVNYNEKKNEHGVSELLLAQNFHLGIDNVKKSDYLNYMEMVCRTNSRVKNKQFHAVISTKGKEHSPEQLKEIAVQYLEKMGYGSNPYLIYYHSDTNNNHVHIVSTRVSKEGLKISDSMERVRSQRIMNEIMNIDLKKKVSDDLNKAMNYSFSGLNQFKMILEQQNWILNEKENAISLIRGGEEQGRISVDQVKQKINNYSPDKERRKQVTALLYKYKEGRSHIELKEVLKKKFGIDLVYHTGKGHSKPYGYTVIDHSGMNVFKGSEVMDLKKILINPLDKNKVEYCNQKINDLLEQKTKISFENLSSELSSIDFILNKNGKVHYKDRELFKLDDSLLKTLKYNSRLEQVNLYNITSDYEAKVLSRLYFVKVKDIELKNSKEGYFGSNMDYANMIKSFLYNCSDPASEFYSANISFIEDNGHVYIVDSERKSIFREDDLGIDIKAEKQQQIEIKELQEFDRLSNGINDHSFDSGYNNFVVTLFQILDQDMYVQEDRRRRKKRGQKPN